MKNLKFHLARFPLKNPKKCLLFGALIVAVFLPFMLNIGFDFGAKVWFRKTDPYIKALDRFEKHFGNDESMAVIIEGSTDVFSPEFQKLLFEITDKVWTIPGIIRSESLVNYHWSYSKGDDITTEAFIDKEKINDLKYLEQRKEEAQKHSTISNLYISNDYKSTIIYGRVVHTPDKETDFNKIYLGAQDILAPYMNKDGFKIHLFGQPTVSYHFQDLSFSDLRTLVPVLLALVIFYLIFCFRTFNGVFIPMCVIACSLAVTGGLIGIFGIKVNTLTFILPSILIAISIADCVHLIASYYKYRAEGISLQLACEYAMMKNLWPIFLTTLSTAIGFFSLVSSDIVPVSDVGLLAGIGTTFALIFSYLFTVPLIVLTNDQGKQTLLDKNLMTKEKVKKYVTFIDRFKGPILISFTLIFIGLGYAAVQNEINSNPYHYFTEEDEVTITNDFALEAFGGVGGPELVFDSGENDGIKNPQFLKQVDSFLAWIGDMSHVNKAASIIDVLKEMNKSLYGGDEKEFRINDSQEVIAQELFLYTMGLPQGLDLNDRIDIGNRFLRSTVMWDIQNSKESLEQVEVFEKEALKRGLKMEVTGKPILFHRMNEHVVNTFFTSMFFALLIITGLLIFIFKNIGVGLMSLIPNVVPVIAGAGILTLLSKPIDVGCAIVASVTLGIAVDDTIHFLFNYRAFRDRGLNAFEAIVDVLHTTGFALIVTTVILVSGFGVFMFAHLVPNINFGILCAFVLSVALLCDLVLLPALILWTNQLMVRRKSIAKT
ncbi:sterol-sensing domain of SREBP cleavage-activation [Bacteriovorax sp. BSW11_IV]|uniref:efflux RND transporter permease subunit n=1 Tax=Bacteriovorax sp. BSW11_IV TaxID=1353529 RepID=UPI000389EEE8|nr:MMPL family transporter [Bacteriovorax sp. BSW11_IV]EQC48970.1 sterol-sensing domain of SREBP cleavage-activation [Bacteriovorax sp. BSW11_IV]